MSHTPGPWTYRKTTGHHVIVIESDYMRDDIGCIVNALEERDQDNARLIAAAPELLAACKHALHHHKATCQALGEYCTDVDADLFGVLEDAIAKAEKPLDRSEEVK